MFLSRLLDSSLPPASLFDLCSAGPRRERAESPPVSSGCCRPLRRWPQGGSSGVCGVRHPDPRRRLALRVGCLARDESESQMRGAQPLRGSPPRAGGMSLAVASQGGACRPSRGKLCSASRCRHKMELARCVKEGGRAWPGLEGCAAIEASALLRAAGHSAPKVP